MRDAAFREGGSLFLSFDEGVLELRDIRLSDLDPGNVLV